MKQSHGTTGAEGVVWNLGDLYSSAEDPRLSGDADAADTRAEALSRAYKGRIGSLSAKELAALIGEYEAIAELGEKTASFTWLDWSAHTDDPARGALLQKFMERGSRLSQTLVFVELEWANLPEEKAKALMEDPLLKKWRHWLEITRRYKPHMLSETEEKLLKEKAVTGREAWVRFFTESQSATQYDWEGKKEPLDVLLNKLREPDRSVRRKAAESVTRGLKGMARPMTFVFNTILAEKSSDDRMRSYESWISARNLDNQVDDPVVEALITAVTSRYDIVARYYALKKKLLGVAELLDYDRYAPLPAAHKAYRWEDAREIVTAAYARFHPRMKEIATLFFDEGWIDAEVRSGKQGGAFSAHTVPSAHPYILLSYQGTADDVMTLAHELGHGVHQFLSRERGMLQQGTPLTMAETASTFGESLVFQAMFDGEKDPHVKLAMLVREIESTFATIFRQIAMNRFEAAIHAARRTEGELSTEKLSGLWLSTQRQMFGDSVTLTEDYGSWWTYISHFIFAPGYVYAYAFGELLVRALYSRYLSQGGDFPERYLSMLGAGGSDWPHRLVTPLGVDLTDPGFWSTGLGLISQMVDAAEKLSREKGA